MTSQSNCCNGAGATQGRPAETDVFQPATDIFETQNEVVILADAPGASPESVDLDFADGTLTVRAAVPPRRAPDGRSLLCEYGVGDFERSFRIGDGIDASRISAEIDQGLLTVTLPKVEAVRPRKIQVRGGQPAFESPSDGKAA